MSSDETLGSEPRAAPRGWQRCRFALGSALLVLLVLAAYWPVVRGEFVWDDLILVAKNQLVTGEFTLRSIWFHTDFPLATVALWFEWLLWGKAASGYHVVNLFLHAVNCVLIWRVLGRLQIRGAWFAAALFAVHPVGAASVAWISELKNTLSLPFFLLGVWWFLGWEERGATDLKALGRIQYALSVFAFLLALLTKTSTVMLPVVLLAIVWWRQGSLSRRVLIAITPYFALALVFGLVTVWFQKHQAILGVTVQTETPWGKLVGAAQAVWFYLGKALVPVRLCLIYPRWPMNASVGAVALVGLALSFLVGWRFRRSWGRHGLLTLGCFVACLFPVLGFFDMYFLVFARVSDHFAYLPLIAIVTLVAAGLHSVLPHRILPLAGLVLLAALGFLTVQRARVFATDEGLWLDTLAKNPSAWNAHNNLGCILAERNQVDEAMKHFAKSVELNPLNVSAHCNLGKGFVAKGDFAEAEKQFRTALQIRPDHVDTLKCYGSALAGQHRREEAVQQLGEAVRLKPDTETRLQLAPLLAVLGKPHDAIRQWRAVLAVESNSFAAINNLAWVLATAADESARDGAEAVSLAERACRATGRNDAKPLGTLAAAYAEAGQFTNAVRAAEQAIEVANATGNSGFARINQQLLEIFRSGRPYHEAPPRAPTSP